VTLDAHVVVHLDRFVLDVQLTVATGEVVAVLGPNGSGKTTLLRALAGLTPMTGSVTLDGDDLGRLGTHNRPIGVVFQDYRLFPHLSALENVAFPLRSSGSGKEAARAEAAAWLTRVGLADLARSKPATLSGGQAQRVALARALVARPRLLLLDEPLAALDATSRADVRSELQRELHDFDGAAVLVTHEPLEALSLADRLVVLEAGRIVQQGAPADVVRRPSTSYVAQLAGLNLLRGTAAAGVLEVDGGGTLVLPDASLTGAALAVVRPSSVLLSTTEPHDSSARNVFPGHLTSMESFGDRVRVGIDGPPSLTADVTPAAVAELRLRPGSAVWVSLKATDLEAYPDVATSPAQVDAVPGT
jgi:molybdate transport system ATP-binding protein